MPALTGDISTVAGTVSTSIGNNVVTNAKLASVATATFKGRVTAGTGNVEDLSVSQVKSALSLDQVDNTSDATKNSATATLTNKTINGGSNTITGIPLTTAVTGILPAANGGTGNGFTGFTGPATTGKTFTLPNASATILTDNTAVTIAQGGTGQTTANAALNALVPIQTGNSGKYLTTDGSNTSWATVSGGGTVISKSTPSGTSISLAFTSGAFAYARHTTTGNTTYTPSGGVDGDVLMLFQTIGSAGHTTTFASTTWPGGSTTTPTGIPTTSGSIIAYTLVNHNGTYRVTGWTVY